MNHTKTLALLLLTVSSLLTLSNIAIANPTLKQAWLIEGFDSPESVIAASDDRLFVSNVNGEGRDKDGNGYISIISSDGKLLQKEWLTGLNAPKGMALEGNNLYVSDIDELVVIDVENASITKRTPVAGAQFLNDVSISDVGVLISDSATQQIFVYKDDKVTSWLKDDRLNGVNGLLPTKNGTLVTAMSKGDLLLVSNEDDANKKLTIKEVATGMINADGIAELASGDYIISSWPGQIYFVYQNGDVKELLNTEKESIYMNDLTLHNNTIIVPNWQPGTVSAYSIEQSEK